MSGFAYWLAVGGFFEAGWPVWRAIFWPYYLAIEVARRLQTKKPDH